MNIGIKDVLQRIRPFFIIYLILLVACLIIKLLYTKDEIYFAVNSRYNPWLDYIEPYVTDLGNGWTIVTLSAILVFFNYRAAFLMAGSYAITSILAQVVKFIFSSARPKLYFKAQLSHLHFVKGVEMLSYNSFPSGHTTTAFSAGLIITYLAKNKNWGFLLVIVASMVGFSRMYLSQHFLEDVIGGSVLGVFITVFWLSYIENKQFIHSPGWSKGLLVSRKS